MTQEAVPPFDCVAWARRVNARWIVHHDLSKSGESYLEYLAKNDPQRLAESCRNAYRLVGERGSVEDPKPWFYGGLFSLATAAEAKEFLAGHSFTAAVIPCAPENPELKASLAAAGQATRETIRRIRSAIARLCKHE